MLIISEYWSFVALNICSSISVQYAEHKSVFKITFYIGDVDVDIDVDARELRGKLRTKFPRPNRVCIDGARISRFL